MRLIFVEELALKIEAVPVNFEATSFFDLLKERNRTPDGEMVEL